MKKIISLLLLPTMLFGLFSCAKKPAETTTDTSTDTTVTTTAESTKRTTTERPAVVEDGRYRVILTSDIHYTYYREYCGFDRDARMQMWVDAILATHEEDPVDLVIVVGDLSLDHHFHNGTYTTDKVSTSKIFVDKYGSQVAEKIPILYLPGNHEQFTNEQWLEITGNPRYDSYVVANNLFICTDAYSETLEPNYDEVNGAAYVQQDVAYIQSEIDKHLECDNVFLVSHHFANADESDEFKALVKNNEKIICLFAGHTHNSRIITLGSEWGKKKIMQTGNFAEPPVGSNAYETFWGYRDVIITEDSITSWYHVIESEFYVNGVRIYVPANDCHGAQLK